METLKNLLVVMDKPKHPQVALQRARALQSDTGARLQLVSFAYDPAFDQKEMFDAGQRNSIKRNILRERREWLSGQVLDAGAALENITMKIVWTKDIAAWVVRRARQGKHDLVLKSAHLSRSLFHMPLDWSLLRECPLPVMLCIRKQHPRKARVLAALDLRHHDRAHENLNRKVLDAAHYFAGIRNGLVHCVYAIEISEALRDLDLVAESTMKAKAVRKLQPFLATLLEGYDIPESRIHLPVGKVGGVVSGIGRSVRADLLVIGTVARTGVRGMLIGNSAERILAKAGGDVLAIKP